MPQVYLDHVTLDFTALKDQMYQTQNFHRLGLVVHALLVVIVQRTQHRHHLAHWELIQIKHAWSPQLNVKNVGLDIIVARLD
jgi:hypothetical protein